MRSLRQRVSLAIKERALRHYGIPFSRHGVHPGLVRFLKASEPITFVDIGASAGDVAKSVELHYGVRRGILIEPQPSRCQELKRRFQEPRFSVYQCALSDEESICKMEVLSSDLSSSILRVRRDMPNISGVLDLSVRETIECRLTTLDTVMAEAQWKDNVDLLKIDVQGAELLTLRGAQQTLPRVRFLLTEVSFAPYYEGACLFAQAYDLITKCGLRLLSLHENFRGLDGGLLECDALFAR